METQNPYEYGILFLQLFFEPFDTAVHTQQGGSEYQELGNGAVREVTSIRLSRAACMAVAMNADQKKEMVKAAQQ